MILSVSVLLAWLLGLVMAGRYRGFLSLDTQDTVCGRIAAPVWWVTKLLYRWHPGPTGRRLNSRAGDEEGAYDSLVQAERDRLRARTRCLVREVKEETLRQQELSRAMQEAAVRRMAGDRAEEEEELRDLYRNLYRTPRP